MPANFDAFGLRFLYPDNWTVAERDEDAGDDGVTLEMPSGGFFAIELDSETTNDADSIEKAAEVILAEYPDAERERVSLPDQPDLSVCDFSFFYLDMLIVSRLIAIGSEGERWIIQIQAESRDFDQNELVFAAIIKQIRDGI